MATNEVQVAAPAPSRFAPVIDLNAQGVTDLVVSQKFAAAITESDNYFSNQTEKFIDKVSSSNKTKFALYAFGALILGIVLTQIIGYMIAGGLALAAAGVLWYFWNYKLPLIIQKAKSELLVQGRAAALREKEKLRQLELQHLSKLKNQARSNPIETRQLVAKGNRSSLAKADEAANKADGFISTQKQKISEHKKRFPKDDISEMENGLALFEKLLSESRQAIVTAYEKLKVYENTTEMIESKLMLATGMKTIAEALGSNGVDKAMQKILSAAATEAVDQEFVESMSAVRTALTALQRENLLSDNT